MSDSSISNGARSDATLEQALRQAVLSVYKKGNLEDLTIKRIRKSAEEDLNLQDDFFKSDPVWKEKSKNVIQSEVEAHADVEGVSTQLTPSKARPSPPKPSEQHRKVQGTKRASIEKAGPKKRRKKDISEVEEPANNKSKARNKKPAVKAKARKPSPSPSLSPAPEEERRDDNSSNEQADQSDHPVLNGCKADQSESEMSELIDEAPKPKRSGKSAQKSQKAKPVKVLKGIESPTEPDIAKAKLSESEMSELIDEAPKPKRSRKSGSTEPKVKKSKSSKGIKNSGEPMDPDLEEIKRLQGWLVKCGIRKVWSKELASYNNSKAKIKHLKAMLSGAGMTGRFSEAKAEQIKEERELKADLEAVQEGAKKWGQATTQEDPNTGRPKRKLARGLEGLDFLNDDDGEEID